MLIIDILGYKNGKAIHSMLERLKNIPKNDALLFVLSNRDGLCCDSGRWAKMHIAFAMGRKPMIN